MRLVCVLLVAVRLSLVLGNNASVSSELYRHVLAGYDRYTRPGENYTHATNVSIGFSILSVKEFQERNGKFSLLGFFDIRWPDERLRWDPSQFGGIAGTVIPQKFLWKPDFVLANSYYGVRLFGEGELNIRILCNGDVIWLVGDTYDINCDADVTYYPMDAQKCRIDVFTWSYLTTEVNISEIVPDVDFQFFDMKNSLWEVTGGQLTRGPEKEQRAVLYVTIKFNRKPDYVIINTILPVCFLCVINVLVFVLPADSGERVGFSITLLLSIAVFLTGLGDSLPRSSKPQIAYLCYFLLAELLTSILIMVLTVFGLKLYWMDVDKPIPRCLRALSCSMRAVCSGSGHCKKRKSCEIEPVQDRDCSSEDLDLPEDQCKPELRPSTSHSNTCESSECLTWQKVASDFDKFCMVILGSFILINNSMFWGMLYAKT